MQPPEANDGWLANLIYLGTVGLAGLVAWVHQYRHGRSKPDEEHRTVVLESAELADMRPMRALNLELSKIRDELRQTYVVVQDNHRIVEDNHRIVEQNREMLVILQKLDRAFEVEEEVKEKLRQRQVQDILDAARKDRDR
jgi:riboflavin biosynthesis pyrimidine reductase